MEFKYTKEEICLEKELNSLDMFVIDFTRILNRLKIKFVLVSGYVSILFGRSRSSEDIDIFIEKLDYGDFEKLWKELYSGFECLNTERPVQAYEDYLMQSHAIRFSRKNKFIPNMEIKFPKLSIDDWAIKNKKKVILNKHTLFVSPIELQIIFKLSLGSEKDIEDAKHLYRLFKERLNMPMLRGFNERFKTKGLFNRYLR
jgi:hypothetical protein